MKVAFLTSIPQLNRSAIAIIDVLFIYCPIVIALPIRPIHSKCGSLIALRSRLLMFYLSK
ncbi:MAG: hypothetical protein SWX82_03830 [Cyanobacteriota bacterium]|nr:hypothetical protein [Cyanobacteriota bacterium]